MRARTVVIALLGWVAAYPSPSGPVTPAAGQPIALVGGTVIDGTGHAPLRGARIVIRGERVVSVGAAVEIPAGAEIVDVTGKTVIPGMIDMHGHLYARATQKMRSQFEAYPLLYLAGGVTSVRSPGDFDPEGTVALRERIRRREAVGPRIFTSGPYFDRAPSEVGWIQGVETPEQARQLFERWKNRIDGVKLYTGATEEILAAVVGAARAAGIPSTAHLGRVTAARAIELGIGGLEHGIFAMPELPLTPAPEGRRTCGLAELDLDAPPVAELIARIIDARVVVDPTFVIFQASLPEFEPVTPDWERYLGPEARAERARRREARARRSAADAEAEAAALACLRRALEVQLRFVRRVHGGGGIVAAGTDPVTPRLIPGYGLHRELQNLADAGLTPVEAIRAASLAAARALGRGDELGSIEPGKLADLVVVAGDPAQRIADVGRTEIVFQGGVRYDPVTLRRAAEGRIN